TVSTAGHELSPWFSQLTYPTAYAPFTPSNSEQRLPPPYYRGCWHGVSRGLRVVPSFVSSHTYEVYIPRDFILHAALLRQAFAHCAKFPTAASRRSMARVSVPLWLAVLSDQLLIVALVSHYLTNKLIRRRLLFRRIAALTTVSMSSRCIMRY